MSIPPARIAARPQSGARTKSLAVSHARVRIAASDAHCVTARRGLVGRTCRRRERRPRALASLPTVRSWPVKRLGAMWCLASRLLLAGSWRSKPNRSLPITEDTWRRTTSVRWTACVHGPRGFERRSAFDTLTTTMSISDAFAPGASTGSSCFAFRSGAGTFADGAWMAVLSRSEGSLADTRASAGGNPRRPAGSSGPGLPRVRVPLPAAARGYRKVSHVVRPRDQGATWRTTRGRSMAWNEAGS